MPPTRVGVAVDLALRDFLVDLFGASRGLANVQLHADLATLARLAQTLARAPRRLVPGRELLNFECDFPQGILKRIDLRGEFSDRDGGWCHRQTRASPVRRRRAGVDQPVHPFDQAVRQCFQRRPFSLLQVRVCWPLPGTLFAEAPAFSCADVRPGFWPQGQSRTF